MITSIIHLRNINVNYSDKSPNKAQIIEAIEVLKIEPEHPESLVVCSSVKIDIGPHSSTFVR